MEESWWGSELMKQGKKWNEQGGGKVRVGGIAGKKQTF